MRHQKSGRRLGRNSPHRTADVPQHGGLAADARDRAHHAAEGQGAASRRGAADHARQGRQRRATAGSRSIACATTRPWAGCSRSSARASRSGPGGYLRILKMGFRRRRLRADGARAAARSARERARGARPAADADMEGAKKSAKKKTKAAAKKKTKKAAAKEDRPGARRRPESGGYGSKTRPAAAIVLRIRCWKANCSATSPGPSPARPTTRSASSCRPTAARSSSTKSARPPPACR